MTDYDYEATVETDGATFTFKGNRPQTVSAQAARIPVLMHEKQVQHHIDIDTPVWKYLKEVREQEEQMRNNAKPDHLDD